MSFYLCANPDVPATESGCSAADTILLDTQTYTDLTKQISHYFTKLEIAEGIVKVIAQVAWEILTHDFVSCWHQLTPGDDGGSASGCAWAAAAFVPGEKVLQALKYAGLVEDAIRTGVGAEKLLGDLKKIFGETPSPSDLANPESVAGMALRLAERMADRAQAANSLDLALVKKLEASGANITRANLVMVVRVPRPGVPLAWLEKGNSKSGLAHILFRHAGEFIERGVAAEDIPKLLNKALTEWKIVVPQGEGSRRPIYETVFNGKTQRVAITVGDNGFIVGANPA